MATEAHIKINLDANKANKQLQDLNKTGKETNKTFQSVDKTFEEVYGDLKPLTTRMGEAEDRLYELALAGKQATAEYKELLKTVGNYRKTQIQTDMAVDAAALTITQKLTTGLGAAAGGFAVVEGAMAAAGMESEAFEQTMQKLAGVMAVLQGINELRESLPLLQQMFSGFSGGAANADAFGAAISNATDNTAEYVSSATEATAAVTDIAQTQKLSAVATQLQAGATTEATAADLAYANSLSTRAAATFEASAAEAELRAQQIAGLEIDAAEIQMQAAMASGDLELAQAKVLEIEAEIESAAAIGANTAALEAELVAAEATVAVTKQRVTALRFGTLAEQQAAAAQGLGIESQLASITAAEARRLAEINRAAAIQAGVEVEYEARLSHLAAARSELAATGAIEAKTAALVAQQPLLSAWKASLASVEKVLARIGTGFIKFATSGIGVFAAAVGAATGFVYSLRKVIQTTEEDSGAQERRNKLIAEGKKLLEENNQSVEEAAKAVANESIKYVLLVNELKHTNAGSKERLDLIKKINTTYGTTLQNLSDETAFQQQLNIAVNEYLNFQRQKFLLTKYESQVNTLLEEQYKLEAELKKLRDPMTLATWNKETLKGGNAQERVNQQIADTELKLTNVIFELDKYAKLSLKIANETDNKYVPAEVKKADAIKSSTGAANEYNSMLEKIVATESEYQDSLKTNQERERQVVTDRYFELIEAAKKLKQDTKLLEEAKNAELADIDAKYLQQKELLSLQIQKILLDTAQFEEENVQTTEEGKLSIRKQYAKDQIALQTQIYEKERDIALSNTDLTEEERQKIIVESNQKIAQLQEAAVEASAQTVKEALANLRTSLKDDFAGTMQELLKAVEYLISNTTALLETSNEQRIEAQTAALESQYEQQQLALDGALANRLISQEQYDSDLREMEQVRREEQKKLDKEAFERSKKIQIANATIAQAQAIMNAYASGVATPIIGPATGAIYAAVAAAFGAVQIAQIKSQPFTAARGGIVPGNGSGRVDTVNAMLAPGEAVINAESTGAFLPVLNAINQLGGGKPLVATQNSQVTQIAGYQQPNEIRAYVVERDITESQSRSAKTRRNARLFGR